jgi:membrane protein implicated in regulation of membrane protease activity
VYVHVIACWQVVGRSAPGPDGRTGTVPDDRTPHRTIRIPDELWEAAKQAAAENGETVTVVVRRALRNYVRATERKRQ